MAQDYYTLEEAAAIVHLAPEELKQMARKGELRSFQDRGTWRFRVQDIQELARRRGMGSDPDLVLGEAPTPKSADSPAPRSPGGKTREAEVFDFKLETDNESVGVGDEFLLEVPGSSRKLPGGGSKSKLDGPKSATPKSGTKSGPRSPGPRSPAQPSSGPRSPGPRPPVQPPPGSDSDVRLVADGSDVDFHLSLDSDAKLVDDSAKAPQVKPRGNTGIGGPPLQSRSKLGGPPAPSRSSKVDLGRRSGLNPPGGAPPGPPVDSGVRLVPMDSDSDVRIVGPGSDEGSLSLGSQPPRSTSDSDIRLEQHLPPASDYAEQSPGMLTEEINLDEELRKEEAQRQAGTAPSRLRPKPPTPPEFPSASPFELSEADLNLPPLEPEPPAPQAKSKAPHDSSSDFELTPAADSSSPLELGSSEMELTPAGDSSSPLDDSSSDFELSPAGSASAELASDEFHLELPDEEVPLGGTPSSSGVMKGSDSGIRLEKPADSGISLEQGGDGSDEIEFELSLDAENTPRPHSPAAAAAGAPAASDSEFELTLDADEPQAAAPPESDSSEFELTLDSDEPRAPAPAESDSEFELTLDDSGGLSPLEGDAAPQVKAPSSSDEKDIFETDFEVPALEEESGSEAVSLDDADTGLDSSDFDLAISEEDAEAEEESGSQVVALDDEEADPAAATVQRKAPGKKKKPAPPPLAFDDEEVEAEVEEGADFGGLADEDQEPVEEEYEEEEETTGGRTVVKEKLIPAAPWGAMPVVLMLPCVAVMILVAMLGFELVQSMSGYKSPGMVTRALSDLFGQKLK